MVELFDTHAHFTGSKEEIDAAIMRARECGVKRIMAVGGSKELNEGALLANTPYKALGYDREQLESPREELDYSNIVAVGEIGLDYYYSFETREKQRELFLSELEKARKLDKPVIIHTRFADDDTLSCLKEVPSKGVIHCFTGEVEFAKKLLDLGFYVSISGIVTFKAADNVREAALVIPDDRLLIETDSPYLAPVPMRGKKNESAFLPYTAKFLAELRKTPFEEFAARTVENSLKIFALSSEEKMV